MSRPLRVQPRSKYGSRTCKYKGAIYHSRREAAYAMELDARMLAGEVFGWTRQVKVPLAVNGVHICNYFVDFEVVTKAGTEFHEVKGFETDVFKLKERLFRAIYPDRTLVVVR